MVITVCTQALLLLWGTRDPPICLRGNPPEFQSRPARRWRDRLLSASDCG